MAMTYEKFLLHLTETDDRYLIMTAENRAAIRNITEALGNKFIDTGITEQTMVGMAAGLALRGRIPVIHALATFLTMRAFEFIRTDIGISGLPVKIVGSVPGFLSDGNGPTHQAIEDISLMRGIPPMKVFCPADSDDLIKGLPQVLGSFSPYYIRFNNLPSEYEHDKNFAEGKAEIVSEGQDVTILTYGFMFRECLEAQQILQQIGIKTGLVNLRTLKPIDEAYILNLFNSTGLIVSVEDHFITGGLFTILSEIALSNRVSPRVVPIALLNHWFKPALLNRVLEYEKMKGFQIAERITTLLREETT